MKNKLEGVGTQAHYESCAIEPIDFIVENNLDFLEGNVIKYVARYKRKNGLEDLNKAKQYLLWLIEREEAKAGMLAFGKEAVEIIIDTFEEKKHETASSFKPADGLSKREEQVNSRTEETTPPGHIKQDKSGDDQETGHY